MRETGVLVDPGTRSRHHRQHRRQPAGDPGLPAAGSARVHAAGRRHRRARRRRRRGHGDECRAAPARPTTPRPVTPAWLTAFIDLPADGYDEGVSVLAGGHRLRAVGAAGEPGGVRDAGAGRRGSLPAGPAAGRRRTRRPPRPAPPRPRSSRCSPHRPASPTATCTRRQAGRPRPTVWPGGHRSVVDTVCIDIPPSRFDEECAFWSERTGWPLVEIPSAPEFRGRTPAARAADPDPAAAAGRRAAARDRAPRPLHRRPRRGDATSRGAGRDRRTRARVVDGAARPGRRRILPRGSRPGPTSVRRMTDRTQPAVRRRRAHHAARLPRVPPRHVADQDALTSTPTGWPPRFRRRRSPWAGCSSTSRWSRTGGSASTWSAPRTCRRSTRSTGTPTPTGSSTPPPTTRRRSCTSSSRRAVAASDANLATIDDLDHVIHRRHPKTGEGLSTRWVILHMIEEYARHNGHADLIRESIDGTTGD